MSVRECGSCSVCCFVAKIDFESKPSKPPHTKCLYVINENNEKGSCSAYNESCRPQMCNNFECGWFAGRGSEEDRPDKSGVMLTLMNVDGSDWIFVIEVRPGAVLGGGKEIIIDAVDKINLPAIVVSYDKKPPNDVGDLVIVKSSLLPRSKDLIGQKIAVLSDDVCIYELLNKR